MYSSEEKERRKREPFVQIPVRLLEHPDLSPIDIVVYAALLSFCHGKKDRCWPALKTIAAVCRKNKMTVFKALKHLAALGLITKTFDKKSQKCTYVFPDRTV